MRASQGTATLAMLVVLLTSACGASPSAPLPAGGIVTELCKSNQPVAFATTRQNLQEIYSAMFLL